MIKLVVNNDPSKEELMQMDVHEYEAWLSAQMDRVNAQILKRRNEIAAMKLGLEIPDNRPKLERVK